MDAVEGKIAVVTGASSGVGRATVKALSAEGVRVTAVARNADGLKRLKDEVGPGLECVAADASQPETAERLLRTLRPDLLVLAAGVTPRMGPVEEQSWEEFSETWNADLKATFHFTKLALELPLKAGSTVVSLSSGAAINGSHYSGGYAGAKRMQWLLAGYAQKRSDARKLGLRFVSVLPKQLIAKTRIAAVASSSYGALLGLSSEQYMQRFEVPLDAEKVAAAILSALSGSFAADVTALGVTGQAVETLA
jgi:NADP-dependent 3-hydroxy acid dehydrogenase YdfG